jgi:hypothetical protein
MSEYRWTGLKNRIAVHFVAACFILVACHEQHAQPPIQASVALNDTVHKRKPFTPGLGEFMSSIQVHHAKLWFAGTNENWELAQFELDEIKESLDDIAVYCTNRPEINSLPMINAAMDTIIAAVQKQQVMPFKNAFIVLTNSCNNCHQATNHAFNRIKIPDAPPFSNQLFKKP